MSKQVVVHDTVYNKADELADKREITIKEAIRDMVREGEHEL